MVRQPGLYERQMILRSQCTQAQHPPYALPEKYAERAHNVFEEMVEKGIEPSAVHFHTLMDCQVLSASYQTIGANVH